MKAFFPQVSAILFGVLAPSFGQEAPSHPPSFEEINAAFELNDQLETSIDQLVGKLSAPKKFEVLKGADSQGRKAVFTWKILSQEYNWAYKHDDAVDDEGPKIDFKDFLKSKEMVEYFQVSQDIIAVGTASEEGRRIDKEVKRAASRADYLLDRLQEAAVDFKGSFHTLNLGKHRKTIDKALLKDANYTIAQRRVIILSVMEKDEGVSLEEALKNALKSSSDALFKIQDYSHFELKKQVEKGHEVGLRN